MSEAVLKRNVLVLNRHWVAIHLCTVRRALGLLYQDLAEVVTGEYETYDFESWVEVSQYAQTDMVRTVSMRIAVPEVIKLIRYRGFPPRHVRLSRRNIYLRDNMQCQYCGRTPPNDELTIDHIVPRSRGGKTVWTNVVLACARCNTLKGDRVPRDAGLRLTREPKKPHWLACARRWPPTGPVDTPLWQKFIDAAYWNVALRE